MSAKILETIFSKYPPEVVPKVFFVLLLPYTLKKMTLQSPLIITLTWDPTFIYSRPRALTSVSVTTSTRVLEGFRMIHSVMLVIKEITIANFFNPLISLPHVRVHNRPWSDKTAQNWYKCARVTLFHDHCKQFSETTFVSNELFFLERIGRIGFQPLNPAKYPAAIHPPPALRECPIVSKCQGRKLNSYTNTYIVFSFSEFRFVNLNNYTRSPYLTVTTQ